MKYVFVILVKCPFDNGVEKIKESISEDDLQYIWVLKTAFYIELCILIKTLDHNLH